MRFSLSLHPPVCTCRALQPFSADNLGALGVRVPMRAPSDQYPHAGKDTDGLSLQARVSPGGLGSRGSPTRYCTAAEAYLRQQCASQNDGRWPVCASGTTVLSDTFPYVSLRYDNLYCAYGSPPLMHWGAPDCVGLTHQTDHAVNVLVGCDLCLSGSHCVDEVSFILVVIGASLLCSCCTCVTCITCLTCWYRRRRRFARSRDADTDHPAGVQLQMQ